MNKKKATNWIDCFAACVNSLGWEWAALCAYLCDQDFPNEMGKLGFPQPIKPAHQPPSGASPSPDLGSNSFPCAQEGDNPKGHVIFQSGDDNEKEVTVFVVPCPGGTIDLVGGKPKPKVGDDPNRPRQAERLTADSPQTLVVRGVTVGVTCKGGREGSCSYRIVQIK